MPIADESIAFKNAIKELWSNAMLTSFERMDKMCGQRIVEKVFEKILGVKYPTCVLVFLSRIMQ